MLAKITSKFLQKIKITSLSAAVAVMHYFQYLTARTLATAAVLLTICYIVLMYVYPWATPSSNENYWFVPLDWIASRWPHVRSVWHNWQSFNGGVIGGLLALIASGAVFYVSIHIDNKNRKRLLFAERTFLAESLSEHFLPYFKICSQFLTAVDTKRKSDGTFDTSQPLRFILPPSPRDKETFVRCISVSEGENAKFIAGYILKLQIFYARLRSTNEAFGQLEFLITDLDMRSHIFDLIELFAMTGKLMQYARGYCDSLDLSYEDFYNAMQSSNLNITTLGEDYEVDIYVRAAVKRGWSPTPLAFF